MQGVQGAVGSSLRRELNKVGAFLIKGGDTLVVESLQAAFVRIFGAKILALHSLEVLSLHHHLLDRLWVSITGGGDELLNRVYRS